MSEDQVSEKASLRKAAMKARKAAFDRREETGAVAAATAKLLAEVKARAPKAASAAGYMPIRSEMDPLPAMTALHDQGLLIGVPVILGMGQPLDFHRWTPQTEMIDGPFGASVPADAALMQPEVVIVPLVGFDARGHRLGYGGGFYDRTLERLRAANPSLTAIGFAYAAQELPLIPTEATDQPLDAIVTEAGVLRP